MSTWPDTLPQCPILNGFSEQRQRNLVSFQPDVGPPKIRRRATSSAVMSSATFRMTTTELSAFNTFFIDTLEDGSLSFEWLHPIDGLSYSWFFDSRDAPKIDRMTPDTFRLTCNLLRVGAGVRLPTASQIGVRFAGAGNMRVSPGALRGAIQARFAGTGSVNAFLTDYLLAFQDNAFQ